MWVGAVAKPGWSRNDANAHSKGNIKMTDSQPSVEELLGSGELKNGHADFRFESDFASVRDIAVHTIPHPSRKGRTIATDIEIGGVAYKPSPRFWNSLYCQYSDFGLNSNLPQLFDHAEIFGRLADRAPNDRFRFTVKYPSEGRLGEPELLAITRPEKPIIAYANLINLLTRYNTLGVTYHDGIVRSVHVPRVAGSDAWKIGDDDMLNRMCFCTPVDGYGKPCIYLGAQNHSDGSTVVAMGKVFKTDINLGSGDNVVEQALERNLDSFNSDEGFTALQKRLISANDSYASVYETGELYKLLVGLISNRMVRGNTGAESETGTPVLNQFHRMTGDWQTLWGIPNIDNLPIKKQRNLPTKASVWDMLKFGMNLASFHSTESGMNSLNAWAGSVVGSTDDYDLAGYRKKYKKFEDFYSDAKSRLVSK